MTKLLCAGLQRELPDYHFAAGLISSWQDPIHIAESRNMFDEPVYSLAPGVSERIGLWYQDRAYLYDNNAVDGEELESLTETIEHTISAVRGEIHLHR